MNTDPNQPKPRLKRTTKPETEGAVAPPSIVKTLEEKLKPFTPDYRNRVVSLYNLYLDGKENRDQRKELEQLGIVEKLMDGDDGGENIQGGQRGVANWIRNNFPGLVPNAMDVSNWMKGKYLPSGCVENMPAADAGGRYKTGLIRVWVERYLAKSNLADGATLDHRARQEKADADLAEMKAESMRRAVSNRYLETKMVEGFVEGFGQWLGLQQDRLVEDRGGIRRLVAVLATEFFNPSAEILTAFDARLAEKLAAANDAMKTAAGKHAEQLVSDLIAGREKETLAALKE